MDNLQLAVLVDAKTAIAVGVIVPAGNGFRKTRIPDAGRRNLPATDCFIQHAARFRKILLSAPLPQSIDHGYRTRYA